MAKQSRVQSGFKNAWKKFSLRTGLSIYIYSTQYNPGSTFIEKEERGEGLMVREFIAEFIN